MIFVLLGILLFFCVLIFISLFFIRQSKKRLQNQIEKAKEILPKIENFFLELNNLSLEYVSKSCENSFENKWNDFYKEVQENHFSSRLPDYEKR